MHSLLPFTAGVCCGDTYSTAICLPASQGFQGLPASFPARGSAFPRIPRLVPQLPRQRRWAACKWKWLGLECAGTGFLVSPPFPSDTISVHRRLSLALLIPRLLSSSQQPAPSSPCVVYTHPQGLRAVRSPGAPAAGRLPALRFESRFEGGNLRAAALVYDNEYDLWLSTDINERCGDAAAARVGALRASDTSASIKPRRAPCRRCRSQGALPAPWPPGASSLAASQTKH